MNSDSSHPTDLNEADLNEADPNERGPTNKGPTPEALRLEMRERAARRELSEAKLLGRAREVAAAAGDRLDRSPHVSRAEQDCLGSLSAAFRG